MTNCRHPTLFTTLYHRRPTPATDATGSGSSTAPHSYRAAVTLHSERRCDYEPPDVLQKGMKRKWPLLLDGNYNYELDVVIEYKCPHRKVTWEFNETSQVAVIEG